MRIPSVSDHYRGAHELIRKEIRELQAPQLEGTSVDDWIEYFMNKYSIPPIVLREAPPVVEQRVDKVQRKDPFGDVYTAEHEVALIGLQVESNENLGDLLRMRGNTWSLNPPRWEYREDCIFVEAEPSSDAARKAIESVKTHVGWLNRSIEEGNRQLPNFIQEQVKRRMETVGAELKPTAGTKRRLSQAPRIAKSVAELRKPQPRQTAIPWLKPDEFQTILDVIEAQGVTFERTPETVAKLNEQDIRNLILSALNAAFNLGAVGEAFSNRGKTDIYLTVPEGGIFIAECKIWDGPHTIHEAVTQILGYLTWRDAYGLVLVFSRNKEFSRVLNATPEAVKALVSIRGELHQIDEHHCSARHVLPSDDYQTVEIHYLVYNVYAEA